MKVSISTIAADTLRAATQRLKKSHPHTGSRGYSSLASEMIRLANEILDERQWEELGGRLLSPRARKKALIKDLADLSHQVDEQGVKSLEATLKKLRHTLVKTASLKEEKKAINDKS